MKFEIVTDISESEFVEQFVAQNKPVVVRGVPFEQALWTPQALRDRVGDLTAQVYDSLFDLENIIPLEEYLDDYFGSTGELPDEVPYIRWYNQLKDVEFAWGDEAFSRVSDLWRKPTCIPANGLLVPISSNGARVDPVSDRFPYRAIQVAARGARTRLHRDPFCSDAVVSQFYGTKEAALYRPDRAQELQQTSDDSSFGGFVDVREDDLTRLSSEPDYHGEIVAGDMIFIPHGWLHDVIVLEDSISVTWNFVHDRGAQEFRRYLADSPEGDSEFEVLQYFFALAGAPDLSPRQMLERI